jgi:RimJ/RimL family protein N-acetyltransferase
MRRHWGQGYAYEAAKASLDYGIDTMGFKDIYAMTDVDNLGSRHLLEKLGFEYKKTFAYDGPSAEFNGLPVTWYELTERK